MKSLSFLLPLWLLTFSQLAQTSYVARQELTAQTAGIHQHQVNTADLPAGVYLYQVQAGNQTSTLRLVKKP